MVLKKYKKLKADADGGAATQLEIKEAIIFSEELLYFPEGTKPGDGDSVESVLADFEHIIPLGYAAEQFLADLKNDVYQQLL